MVELVSQSVLPSPIEVPKRRRGTVRRSFSTYSLEELCSTPIPEMDIGGVGTSWSRALSKSPRRRKKLTDMRSSEIIDDKASIASLQSVLLQPTDSSKMEPVMENRSSELEVEDSGKADRESYSLGSIGRNGTIEFYPKCQDYKGSESCILRKEEDSVRRINLSDDEQEDPMVNASKRGSFRLASIDLPAIPAPHENFQLSSITRPRPHSDITLSLEDMDDFSLEESDNDLHELRTPELDYNDQALSYCCDGDDIRITVLALCKSSERNGNGQEQLAWRHRRFPLSTSLTEVATWFASDSETLDTFTLNQRLFEASSVVSIEALLGSEHRPEDTGLVICIGPVENAQGMARLAYSVTPCGLDRIKTFMSRQEEDDDSSSNEANRRERCRTSFVVQRKLGPKEIGWVDPFDWDEPEYEVEESREDWLKPRSWYSSGQKRKRDDEWKPPRKLGPRDFQHHKRWTSAVYKEAIPDFMENFLKPKPIYTWRRLSKSESHVPRKSGPRETGIAKGFVPYVGWREDDKDWLEEKLSAGARRWKKLKVKVPRKDGPRDIGWETNFVPYIPECVRDKDEMGEEKPNIARKLGPRDIGFANKWTPYRETSFEWGCGVNHLLNKTGKAGTAPISNINNSLGRITLSQVKSCTPEPKKDKAKRRGRKIARKLGPREIGYVRAWKPYQTPSPKNDYRRRRIRSCVTPTRVSYRSLHPDDRGSQKGNSTKPRGCLAGRSTSFEK